MKAQELIKQMDIELSKSDPDLAVVTKSLKTLKEIIGFCKECEADFFKVRYDQLFCSEKCSARFRQRKRRERLKRKDVTNTEYFDGV